MPCAIRPGDHLARHRGAGDAEAGQPAEALQPALLHLGQQIDRVRRHADQEAGVGFQNAVGEARAARQVVDDELGAHRQRHHLGAEAEIVAERRQRIDHRGVADAPVLGKLARVGEQRVVGVHHALRLAGGAGGEGEIDDLVGIGLVRAALVARPARARRNGALSVSVSGFEPIDMPQRRHRLERLDQIALVGVGAVAVLPDEGDRSACAASVRPPRRRCGRGAATGSRSRRSSSRRAARPRFRSGSAARRRRAGLARTPWRARSAASASAAASNCR